MAEDYYYEDQESETETETPETESEAAEPAEDTEKEESPGALVPKAMCGMCEPGDTMTFKVVKVYDDEVELAPVRKSKPTTTKKPMSFDEEVDMAAMKGE